MNAGHIEHAKGTGEKRAGVRAAVLRPWPRRKAGRIDAEAGLAEGVGLACAIDLDVVHRELVPLSRPRPATLFGAGVVDRLAALIADQAVELAVVDGELSPVQQRNLERAWSCKVIDRTGLILEIFGARARTSEGQLQVELAALTYQRSRLVRSWTHLERQRGALGFIGGPGESQLELDRRLIGDRIVALRKRLAQVRRTRGLHRAARARVPYPIVALVGYTNAGKSTLFNRLTDADAFAHDQLFATLDPTMRSLVLPDGRRAILSDTVGFISDLPHDLVAAFSATLEEVTAADLVVHVRDIAHPSAERQKADVERVLQELAAGDRDGLNGHAAGALATPLEALNKIDLLDAAERAARLADNFRHADAVVQGFAARHRVAVSAATGEGVDNLLAAIAARLRRAEAEIRVDVALSDGANIAWLYRRGTVVARRDDASDAHLTVRLAPADRDRLARRAGVRIRG